jgi:basic membrane lipoprotein Med (substrate-binding protein (PBP1-ABC) superfamily)
LKVEVEFEVNFYLGVVQMNRVAEPEVEGVETIITITQSITSQTPTPPRKTVTTRLISSGTDQHVMKQGLLQMTGKS